MEHPLLQLLDSHSSESDLLEKLLTDVLENKIDQARVTAARIEATRDLKFTLKKLIKEYDHPGGRAA
jgi:hypothetical protein